MLFSDLEYITKGKIIKLSRDREITTLLTDSRKLTLSEGAVFFAVGGLHHDGHQYIKRLYDQGVRQFVVERTFAEVSELKEANIIQVKTTISALQDIAAEHRSGTSIPVIGITGSNGKTIIKEWLYQLLSPDFRIAKNPASYNSQLGVPLSVWQLQHHHTLGIFEAGISTVNEMERLEKVLKPSIGIFTNIGPAHDEGFNNTAEKIREKIMLFKESKLVIYCKDHLAVDEALTKSGLPVLSWGYHDQSSLRIEKQGNHYLVTGLDEQFPVHFPFTDPASVENCFHCIAVLVHFGVPPQEIQTRILSLKAIPMRLELKEGINGCQIIDDTYNNDLAGLQVSLDFLSNQNQKQQKRVILSDIHESGLSDNALVKKIAALIESSHIDSFIGIGPDLYAHQNDFPPGSGFYRSTEDFLKGFNLNLLHDEVILIKGARLFAFEKIVNHLQRKTHGTVMEIDLGALVHNLNYFKSRVKPSTKIMAMVKAFAYGSGSNEIANVLQYHKIDYLGVAYADEGIDLRRNNITLPIMVMNPSEESFATLIKYDLEPEIYNLRTFESLLEYLQGQPCRVHIKIDTGMHRLGFEEREIDQLIGLLKKNQNIKVASIFTHLSGADESSHDDFSRRQVLQFTSMADRISNVAHVRPLYHVLNSPGILRLPEFQFDMVRLGIGLYGVDPTEKPGESLKPVATLKTVISQIKTIEPGETVGYGRKGKTDRQMKIATIAIGYADGFSRAFSNGKGKVLVNGTLAKVIGNVCMDMTMIDITGIEANEGDDVIVFGKQLPIEELAASIDTIPYEILTSTSERVKRIFVAESI